MVLGEVVFDFICARLPVDYTARLMSADTDYIVIYFGPFPVGEVIINDGVVFLDGNRDARLTKSSRPARLIRFYCRIDVGNPDTDLEAALDAFCGRLCDARGT